MSLIFGNKESSTELPGLEEERESLENETKDSLSEVDNSLELEQLEQAIADHPISRALEKNPHTIKEVVEMYDAKLEDERINESVGVLNALKELSANETNENREKMIELLALMHDHDEFKSKNQGLHHKGSPLQKTESDVFKQDVVMRLQKIFEGDDRFDLDASQFSSEKFNKRIKTLVVTAVKDGTLSQKKQSTKNPEVKFSALAEKVMKQQRGFEGIKSIVNSNLVSNNPAPYKETVDKVAIAINEFEQYLSGPEKRGNEEITGSQKEWDANKAMIDAFTQQFPGQGFGQISSSDFMHKVAAQITEKVRAMFYALSSGKKMESATVRQEVGATEEQLALLKEVVIGSPLQKFFKETDMENMTERQATEFVEMLEKDPKLKEVAILSEKVRADKFSRLQDPLVRLQEIKKLEESLEGKNKKDQNKILEKFSLEETNIAGVSIEGDPRSTIFELRLHFSDLLQKSMIQRTYEGIRSGQTSIDGEGEEWGGEAQTNMITEQVIDGDRLYDGMNTMLLGFIENQAAGSVNKKIVGGQLFSDPLKGIESLINRIDGGADKGGDELQGKKNAFYSVVNINGLMEGPAYKAFEQSMAKGKGLLAAKKISPDEYKKLYIEKFKESELYRQIQINIKMVSKSLNGMSLEKIEALSKVDHKRKDELLKSIPDSEGNKYAKLYVDAVKNGEINKTFSEFMSEDVKMGTLDRIKYLIKKIMGAFKAWMAELKGDDSGDTESKEKRDALYAQMFEGDEEYIGVTSEEDFKGMMEKEASWNKASSADLKAFERFGRFVQLDKKTMGREAFRENFSKSKNAQEVGKVSEHLMEDPNSRPSLSLEEFDELKDRVEKGFLKFEEGSGPDASRVLIKTPGFGQEATEAASEEYSGKFEDLIARFESNETLKGDQSEFRSKLGKLAPLEKLAFKADELWENKEKGLLSPFMKQLVEKVPRINQVQLDALIMAMKGDGEFPLTGQTEVSTKKNDNCYLVRSGQLLWAEDGEAYNSSYQNVIETIPSKNILVINKIQFESLEAFLTWLPLRISGGDAFSKKHKNGRWIDTGYISGLKEKAALAKKEISPEKKESPPEKEEEKK